MVRQRCGAAVEFVVLLEIPVALEAGPRQRWKVISTAHSSDVCVETIAGPQHLGAAHANAAGIRASSLLLRVETMRQLAQRGIMQSGQSSSIA